MDGQRPVLQPLLSVVIAKPAFELDAHEVVGQQMQALLREPWSHNVTRERLASTTVMSVDAGCGVQREAYARGTQARQDNNLELAVKRHGWPLVNLVPLQQPMPPQ